MWHTVWIRQARFSLFQHGPHRDFEEQKHAKRRARRDARGMWLKPQRGANKNPRESSLLVQRDAFLCKLRAINQQHARELSKLNEKHAEDLSDLTCEYLDVATYREANEFNVDVDCTLPLVCTMPSLIKLLDADLVSAAIAASALDSMLMGAWFDEEGDGFAHCCQTLRKAAVEAGAVDALGALLRRFAGSLASFTGRASEQSRAAENAAGALYRMLVYEHGNTPYYDGVDYSVWRRVRNDILKACGVHILVKTLRPVVHSCNHEGCSCSADHSFLRLLMALTDPGDLGTVPSSRLHRLTEAAAACTAVHDAGGLRLLVAKLNGPRQDQWYSSDIIESLARVACMTGPGGPDERDLIQDAGAIPSLVALLRHEVNSHYQTVVCAILYYLMAGLPDTEVLRHYQNRNAQHTVYDDGIDLNHMANRACNTANKAAIRAASVIPLLLPHAREQSNAARALRALARDATVAAEVWSALLLTDRDCWKWMCPGLLSDLEPSAVKQLDTATAGNDVAQLQAAIEAATCLCASIWPRHVHEIAKLLAEFRRPMASALSQARSRITELEAEAARVQKLAALGLASVPYPDDFCCAPRAVSTRRPPLCCCLPTRLPALRLYSSRRSPDRDPLSLPCRPDHLLPAGRPGRRVRRPHVRAQRDRRRDRIRQPALATDARDARGLPHAQPRPAPPHASVRGGDAAGGAPRRRRGTASPATAGGTPGHGSHAPRLGWRRRGRGGGRGRGRGGRAGDGRSRTGQAWRRIRRRGGGL